MPCAFIKIVTARVQVFSRPKRRCRRRRLSPFASPSSLSARASLGGASFCTCAHANACRSFVTLCDGHMSHFWGQLRPPGHGQVLPGAGGCERVQQQQVLLHVIMISPVCASCPVRLGSRVLALFLSSTLLFCSFLSISAADIMSKYVRPRMRFSE